MSLSRLSFCLVIPFLLLGFVSCEPVAPVEPEETPAPSPPEKYWFTFSVTSLSANANEWPQRRISYSGVRGAGYDGHSLALAGGPDSFSLTTGESFDVSIIVESDTLPGTYEIGCGRIGRASGGTANASWASTSTQFLGQLTIDSFDPAKRIISGTFSFTGSLRGGPRPSLAESIFVSGTFRVQVRYPAVYDPPLWTLDC